MSMTKISWDYSRWGSKMNVFKNDFFFIMMLISCSRRMILFTNIYLFYHQMTNKQNITDEIFGKNALMMGYLCFPWNMFGLVSYTYNRIVIYFYLYYRLIVGGQKPIWTIMNNKSITALSKNYTNLFVVEIIEITFSNWKNNAEFPERLVFDGICK